jgi:hypothetical protein
MSARKTMSLRAAVKHRAGAAERLLFYVLRGTGKPGFYRAILTLRVLMTVL